MVATPPHVPGSQYDALIARVAKLERDLASVANKTLFSANIGAGGLTINSGGDLNMGTGGDINLSAGGHIKDGVGNILFSADGITGQRLSTPFLSVPMYQEFQNRTTGNGFTTCLASDIGTAEKSLWEGSIPLVVAPLIMWKFLGGDATSSTVTATYRLYVNGSLIDSFAANSVTIHSTSQANALDITEVTDFGTGNVSVIVTAQCSVSNADQILCQMLGVSQCGR